MAHGKCDAADARGSMCKPRGTQLTLVVRHAVLLVYLVLSFLIILSRSSVFYDPGSHNLPV